MLFLPEMFLEGGEITISSWCLDPLQLMTDKVLLILTWDSVLIETVGAWLYPLSSLGGQQILSSLLSFPVWGLSLGGEYGLPVGQAGCPREITLQKGPQPASLLIHGTTLSCLHAISWATPIGTEYKFSTIITYSLTHPFWDDLVPKSLSQGLIQGNLNWNHHWGRTNPGSWKYNVSDSLWGKGFT